MSKKFSRTLDMIIIIWGEAKQSQYTFSIYTRMQKCTSITIPISEKGNKCEQVFYIVLLNCCPLNCHILTYHQISLSIQVNAMILKDLWLILLTSLFLLYLFLHLLNLLKPFSCFFIWTRDNCSTDWLQAARVGYIVRTQYTWTEVTNTLCLPYNTLCSTAELDVYSLSARTVSVYCFLYWLLLSDSH